MEATLLTNILVLFMVILIGFFARTLGLLNQETVQALVKLILNVTVPSLILVSLNIDFNKSVIVESALTAGIAIVATLFLIVSANFTSRIVNITEYRKKSWQFMLIFGNVTFIGYPVCYFLYGERGIFLAAIYDFVQTIAMFTYGIWLMSGSHMQGTQRNRFWLEPVIIALILGLIMFILGIDLPKPIFAAFNTVGQTTTALAMLAIGLILDFRYLRGNKDLSSLLSLLFLKNLAIPGIFLLITRVIDLPVLVQGVSLIMLATPAAMLSTVLAEKYAGDAQFAAQGVFLTTLASIFTIPIMITLL